MEENGKSFGISKTSGITIAMSAILISALLILPIVSRLFPSSMDDALGILVGALIFPVIALFRPLQRFIIFPDGLGFSNISSKRVYKVLWAEVTDIRLKRDMFRIMNLEFQKKDKGMYKKVPLSIIPENREFLRLLLESFPSAHPKRILLEHLVSSFVSEHH